MRRPEAGRRDNRRPRADPEGVLSKLVAIVQSNYLPWKGYFDLINWADEFILFDDRQYTRRDWRNRNQIKTPHGPRWLTIPVQVKGRYHQRIDETKVADPTWARRHWESLKHCYARAPFFAAYRPLFEELYLGMKEEYLSRINYRFLQAVCGLLGIRTRLTWSTAYRATDGRTERLIDLCRQAGATAYLSGPVAQAYLDEVAFRAAGLAVRYADYAGYPRYRQLYPPFDHHVSIVDLLFNEGPDAPRYLLSPAGAEGDRTRGGPLTLGRDGKAALPPAGNTRRDG
jgi:WbqC-like protein family